MSDKGKAQLAGLEGIILSKYLDSVGVQTIAIGSTVSDIPDLPYWSWDKKLTLKEAITLFEAHIEKYETAVNKALKVNIEQYQFDALVSICYNIGIGGMSNSTFMRRINANASLSDIKNAIMMWDIPKEITGRRMKEVNLYVDGIYSEKGWVTISPVSASHRPQYSKGVRFDMLSYLDSNNNDKIIETNKNTEIAVQEKEMLPTNIWAAAVQLIKKLFS